ncbi:MAG: multiheme c-type cytochrome [Thermincolia bacterium]
MNKKILMVFTVFGLILLLGSVSPVWANNYNTCIACHDFALRPMADPAKFNLVRIDDVTIKGTVVDKSTCIGCHNPNWTSHQGVSLIKVEVQKGVYGAFQGPESPLKPATQIHYKHSGSSLMSNSFSCQRCHAAVSCLKCHNNVAHSDHYNGNPTNKLTNTPIVTPIPRVVDGVNHQDASGNWFPYADIKTTCAASECHQTLPQVVEARSDGQDLCKNCHTVDKQGHGDLTVVHTSEFPQGLKYPTGPQTVNCGGCHDNILDKEHQNRNLKCAACHGQTAPPAVKEAVKNNRKGCFDCHLNPPAGHKELHMANKTNNLATVPLHKDCNACHNNQEVKTVIKNLAESTAPDYSCLDCHQGMLLSPYHKGDYNGKLVGVMDVHVGCDTCHSKVDATINNLAKTAPSTGYSCNDCHNGIVEPKLQASHQARFTVNGAVYDTTGFHRGCGACHSIRDVTPIISSLKGKSGYQCDDCHNLLPIKYKPEHLGINDIETNKVSCSNCHDFNLTVGQSSNVTSIHSGKGCITCHGSTEQAVKDFIAQRKGQENAPYNCNDCHSLLATKHNKLHLAKSYLSSGNGGGCVNCHKTLDVVSLHEKTPLGCDTCHGSQVSATVNKVVYSNLSSLPNRPGFACDSCHTDMQGGHKHEVSKFEANPEVDCALCHRPEEGSPSVELAALHKEQGFGCSACHNSTFEGSVIDNDGVMEVPVCSTCHDGNKVQSREQAHRGITGTAPPTADCSGCHDFTPKPAADPAKFTLPKVQDGVRNNSVVDRSACITCHRPNWVFHQSAKNLIRVEVTTGVYGRFKTPESPWKPASEIHTKHSGTAWMSSYYSCQRCHGEVSCQKCHATVAHEEHYSGKPVNNLTVQPIVTPTLRVVNGFNYFSLTRWDWMTYFDTQTTCAASECHGTLPKVIEKQPDGKDLCLNCHNADKGGHGDVSILHTTVFPTELNYPDGPKTINCASCHSNSLDVEHRNRSLSCNVCHGIQVRTTVKEAVYNNLKGCFDCHTNPPSRHTPIPAR